MLKQRPALRRSMELGRQQINRRPQDSSETRKLLFGVEDKPE
jgi:GSH-dependent disulfide-bond oxidoreductase